jgi:hypothetical protein
MTSKSRMPLSRELRNLAFAATMAAVTVAVAPAATAAESIEFVSEHLPEIAMDNRYASLPLWDRCDGAGNRSCFGVGAGYARTHGGALSAEGPLLSLSLVSPIGARLHLTTFAFFDSASLGVGVDRRPLAVLFANPPLTLPADAEFTGMNGSETDAGLGVALGGPAHWRFLSSFEWSAGLMWQRVKVNDLRFDYRILSGPDTGITGTVDYSASYVHLSPFVGAAWPRASGRWMFTPHFQIAMPLPKRGFAGHITGPGFDLAGDQSANGHGKHFGDPSVTAGFEVTYQPWQLTVDLGSAVWQALVEPQFHEGLKHNLMLSAYRMF